MKPDFDASLPPDLTFVADELRTQRATLDPLALDRVKLRATRGSAPRRHGSVLHGRVVALLTVLVVGLGTAGGFASAGSSGTTNQSSQITQYGAPCPSNYYYTGYLCVHSPVPGHWVYKLGLGWVFNGHTYVLKLGYSWVFVL